MDTWAVLSRLVVILISWMGLSLSFGTIVGLNAGAQYDISSVSRVISSGAKVMRLNFIVTANQTGALDAKLDLY
jgi:hypothetical protein